MASRAPKYTVASLLVPLFCVAGTSISRSSLPDLGASVPALRYIAPASRLATPAGGTTYYVNDVGGSDKNNCRSPQRACKTMQRAVFLSASRDTIDVAAAVYRENVTVQHSLQFIGAGPGKTIVNGERRSSEFVIAFNPNAEVSISGMTMLNGIGAGEDGGAIYHCFGKLTLRDVVLENNDVHPINRQPGNGYAGAMYNCPGSTATIIDSTIRNNSAKVGGAICNGGLLTIIGSTFYGNTARGGAGDERGGGAIFNYGTLHVENSTFNGNTAAAGVGGAIHNGELLGGVGGAQIDNSTISGNTAALGDFPGGGIYNRLGQPIYLQNTIVAGNKPQDCGGAPLATEGFNLSSDKSCDLDGAGDLNGVDPKLGSLQDNGGPTWTMALLAGSSAIDAGNRSGCRNWLGRQLATDQRGMPRPDSHEPRGCDIGAYESQ
jgi:hypothetical protein